MLANCQKYPFACRTHPKTYLGCYSSNYTNTFFYYQYSIEIGPKPVCRAEAYRDTVLILQSSLQIHASLMNSVFQNTFQNSFSNNFVWYSLQTLQVPRIMHETHAFGPFLSVSRLWPFMGLKTVLANLPYLRLGLQKSFTYENVQNFTRKIFDSPWDSPWDFLLFYNCGHFYLT